MHLYKVSGPAATSSPASCHVTTPWARAPATRSLPAPRAPSHMSPAGLATHSSSAWNLGPSSILPSDFTQEPLPPRRLSGPPRPTSAPPITPPSTRSLSRCLVTPGLARDSAFPAHSRLPAPGSAQGPWEGSPNIRPRNEPVNVSDQRDPVVSDRNAVTKETSEEVTMSGHVQRGEQSPPFEWKKRYQVS